MNSENIPFLGTGWSFPPEFGKGKNALKLVSGAEDIKESLFILLSTKYGERLMTPDFGCDLHTYLFEPIDIDLEQKLEDEIRKAILLYETRISIEKLVFTPDINNGVIQINIEYVIRTTNTRTNIVFPFYLSEGTNL